MHYLCIAGVLVVVKVMISVGWSHRDGYRQGWAGGRLIDQWVRVCVGCAYTVVYTNEHGPMPSYKQGLGGL